MFRIIKYFLIFFLGYYIIRKLFGTGQGGERKDVTKAPDPVPSGKEPQGRFSKDDGEYIEYEEIK